MREERKKKEKKQAKEFSKSSLWKLKKGQDIFFSSGLLSESVCEL